MRVVTPAGLSIELGTTETTPTIGIVDYSRRVTDDFGVTTVVERGFARTMSVRLAVPFDGVDALQRQLADLRATSALWVADERYDWLSANGFYKDFSLDLNVPPLSYCTLTIEGLADTEASPDSGGDPAPDGQTSTLRLLQPVAITDAVLAASSAAETDYAAWSAGASYPIGARAIVVATHRVYESVADANVGNEPSGGSGKWLDVGPTNRWAMFDQALGTATIAADAIIVTLAAGTIDGVALLDVAGSTVRVQAAGYDRTVAAGAGTIAFLDLPSTAGPVTVTIAGSGPVSVGTLLVGRVVGLGITEASPTAAITDFSRKVVDDFGEVTVVQRAWAKRMTARALIRTDALDVVANRIATVRARPSLWIGQTGLDSLTVYGFFKDFSIEVADNVSKLSISIEGLSTAAPPSPGVTWSSIIDPDKTKPADNATNSRDPASPFGDRTVGVVLTGFDAVREDLDVARAEVDITVPTLFDLAKSVAVLNGYMQAKTTLDGKAIGTIVVDVREVGESTVEELHLIGAKNTAGTAFLLNLDTVYVSGTMTLAQRFVSLEAYAAGQAEAVSTTLSQAITDEASARAAQIVTVRTEFGDDIEAATQSITSAYSDADSALSERIDQGTARADGLDAQFQSQQTASADADQALGQRIDTVQAAAGTTNAQVSLLTSALVTASGTAVAKAVLSLKVNGHVGGIVATNDGTASSLDLDFDAVRIFKPDGLLLFQASGDQVYMPNVVIDTLMAGSIQTAHVAAGQFTGLSSYPASDVAVTATETTIIETAMFTVGDGIDGRAIAIMSFSQDGTGSADTGMRVRVYLDTGGGYGSPVRDRVQGVRTAGADTRSIIPISFSIPIASATTAKVKVTGQATAFGGGGNTNTSWARDITLDLFKGLR